MEKFIRASNSKSVSTFENWKKAIPNRIIETENKVNVSVLGMENAIRKYPTKAKTDGSVTTNCFLNNSSITQ
jgi:hypothetical protein